MELQRHTNKQLEVFPSSLVNGIVVLDARHDAWRKRCLEIGRSHFQSLFYFVPQEKRLTRRSPWEWKNMRAYVFHPENMNIWPEIGKNR